MTNEKKIRLASIEKIKHSIDDFFMEDKEERLKAKFSNKIKNSIFTDEISIKLNECDFTGLTDEEDDIIKLFESIFPVFVKDGASIFRLYKHKIEVDLSDEMKDRYIYMFSNGRLTSGLFQCFSLTDDEYVYGIKRIIDIIPKIREELLTTIENFRNNIQTSIKKDNEEIRKIADRKKIAEENYNELEKYFSQKIITN